MSAPPTRPRVPPLIKRNTILVALSQSFSGAGMPLGYGIGPLIVVAVTGSASLAGLSVGLFGLSRFLVSYPIGKVTDAYGRKPGIQLGLAIAMVGALVVAWSVSLKSIVALTAGLLIFGMGMAAAHQLRVAVADMFPPRRRAEALGYLALGSIAGLAFGPILVAIAERAAPTLNLDPLALPWLMLPVMTVTGMVLVTFIRPDPKVIGENLPQYFPGAPSPLRRQEAARPDFRVMTMLRRMPILLAIMANSAAQGNMSIVMVLTSLVLHHHGHSLTAIALSHMFHTVGMFGLTIPLGRLADRLGRERVMYPGVAVALLGAVLVTFTAAFWSVTLGTFLVGLGWAGANVASTALIADRSETAERGRAIGVNDSAAGAMTVIAGFVTGPLVQWGGLSAAGGVALAFASVPLVAAAIYRLRRG
ncbi:MAG: MFS transporter [Hyphomicrobiales bacterium]|nr:MFS transporter [Hyphomicrobiales bacterium]